MDSILHYKQDGYLDINNFLRTSPLPVPEKLDSKSIQEYISKLKLKSEDYKKSINERLEHIKNIDKYMTYNTYGNKTFYRGFSHMGDTFENLLKEGGSLISKNYSSTSWDKEIPKNFINNNTTDAIISFKIPMDVRSFDYEPLEKMHKHLEAEKEVLLERNLEFDIVDKINGIYIATIRKHDPYKSKELSDVEKIKKELTKIKLKEAEEETYKKDIEEFIKNDYDEDTDIEDAFLDFSLLYTVDPKKEEDVKKVFTKMIKKQKGGGKRKMKGGKSKFFNIFKMLKREKQKKKLKKLKKNKLN